MKNKQLYQKTVDILVDAYFKNTLEHTNCYACAVGNIIAANNNIGFMPATPEEKDHERNIWSGAGTLSWDRDYDFNSNLVSKLNRIKYEDHPIDGLMLKHLKSTGYTVNELHKIERAFEEADRGKSGDEWMFNGLMAVIDILDEIHENTNQNISLTSKSKFHEKVSMG